MATTLKDSMSKPVASTGAPNPFSATLADAAARNAPRTPEQAPSTVSLNAEDAARGTRRNVEDVARTTPRTAEDAVGNSVPKKALDKKTMKADAAPADLQPATPSPSPALAVAALGSLALGAQPGTLSEGTQSQGSLSAPAKGSDVLGSGTVSPEALTVPFGSATGQPAPVVNTASKPDGDAQPVAAPNTGSSPVAVSAFVAAPAFTLPLASTPQADLKTFMPHGKDAGTPTRAMAAGTQSEPVFKAPVSKGSALGLDAESRGATTPSAVPSTSSRSQDAIGSKPGQTSVGVAPAGSPLQPDSVSGPAAGATPASSAQMISASTAAPIVAFPLPGMPQVLDNANVMQPGPASPGLDLQPGSQASGAALATQPGAKSAAGNSPASGSKKSLGQDETGTAVTSTSAQPSALVKPDERTPNSQQNPDLTAQQAAHSMAETNAAASSAAVHAGSSNAQPDAPAPVSEAAPITPRAEDAAPQWNSAASTAVHSAQLSQAMHGSEMRMGMNSAEFGNISITASVTHQTLSAQISLDHAELTRVLTAQLPGIQAKLGDAYGLQSRVEVRDGSSSAQGDSGRQQSDHPRTYGTGAGVSTRAASQSAAVLSVPAAVVPGSSTRLDVLI